MQQSSDKPEHGGSIIDHCKQHSEVTAANIIENLFNSDNAQHKDSKKTRLATAGIDESAAHKDATVTSTQAKPAARRVSIFTAIFASILMLGGIIFFVAKNNTPEQQSTPTAKTAPPPKPDAPKSAPQKKTVTQNSQQNKNTSETYTSNPDASKATSLVPANSEVAVIESKISQLKAQQEESRNRVERIKTAQERIAQAQAELERLEAKGAASLQSQVPSGKSQSALKIKEAADVAGFLNTLLYYRSKGFNYALADLYAPKIQFRAYGNVDRSYVHNYYEREKKQWQEQEYALLGNPSILSSNIDGLNIRYKTKFSRTPTPGGNVVSGTETLELMLKVSGDGSVQIVKEIKK